MGGGGGRRWGGRNDRVASEPAGRVAAKPGGNRRRSPPSRRARRRRACLPPSRTRGAAPGASPWPPRPARRRSHVGPGARTPLDAGDQDQPPPPARGFLGSARRGRRHGGERRTSGSADGDTYLRGERPEPRPQSLRASPAFSPTASARRAGWTLRPLAAGGGGLGMLAGPFPGQTLLLLVTRNHSVPPSLPSLLPPPMGTPSPAGQRPAFHCDHRPRARSQRGRAAVGWGWRSRSPVLEAQHSPPPTVLPRTGSGAVTVGSAWAWLQKDKGPSPGTSLLRQGEFMKQSHLSALFTSVSPEPAHQ